MLRNIAYGGLALVGGAITGIAISSWATPRSPQQVGDAPEGAHIASVAQPTVTLASASSGGANSARDCSPWEVSEVVMEAILNEMIYRGWRPPTQAELLDASVRPADPGAFVPLRSPTVSPVPFETSAPFQAPEPPAPEQGQLPSGEAAAPAEIQTAPLPAPPEPAIVIETPAPPSN